MMGQNSTTSNKLDFLQVEEVSNEAAEAISGGKELVLTGGQELSFGLFDFATMPFDLLTSVLGSVTELTSALGVELPALPTPKIPEIAIPELPKLS